MKVDYRNFRIRSVFLGNKCWECSGGEVQNYNNHVIAISNVDTCRRVTFEFWGSIMKPRIETAQELLFAFYCFLSDGNSSRYGFSEFCSEFGYDEDSRRAHRIFKSCKKLLKKAEKIGIDEDEACSIMNDLSENYGC